MPRQPGQGDQAVEVKRLSDEGAPPALRHPGADVQERRRNVAAVRRKVSRRGSNDAVYGLAGVTREVAETR
jgi:hypothetical protein